MRILHTSDWHLGHAFCERSRATEQQDFLDWLRRTVEEHEVDALVVAGDVFDTANPPADAQAMYYRFLADLAGADGRTRSGGRRHAVVVGGNHDSPARLDAPREVLDALRTQVVGGYDAGRTGAGGDPAGVLVPIAGAGGQVGLVIAAVPFLNDWRIGVRGFEAGLSDQLASMQDKFREVYARLAHQAESRFPGVPLMATGHLTCLERAGLKVEAHDAVPAEINRVGTLGAMGPDIFDPRYAYVALGHIHRGFAVDKENRVWYAGTPVQVSAVETPDARRVLLVDVDANGATVQKLPVPTRRRLLPLSGPLDEVIQHLRTLKVPDGELPPYVTIQATLGAPNLRAPEALLAAARDNPMGPAVVHVQTAVVRQGGATVDHTPVFGDRPPTPTDAFLYAWRTRYGEGATPPDPIMQRFLQLVERNAAKERR